VVIGYSPVLGDRPEAGSPLLLQADHYIGSGVTKGDDPTGSRVSARAERDLVVERLLL
jgi:hypothetical protein